MLCVLLDNLAVTQSVNTPCSLAPTWTQTAMCTFGQFGCDSLWTHLNTQETECYVCFWTIWLWRSLWTHLAVWIPPEHKLDVMLSMNKQHTLALMGTQTENCVHLNNKLENGVPVSACVCERKDSAHLTVLATAGVEAPPLLQLQLVIRVFTHLVLWCAVTDLKSQAPSEPAVARKTDPVFPQTVQWTVVMLLKQTHRANQPY